MIRTNSPPPSHTDWETPEELAAIAMARMQQGFAPPPEVYQVQYRSRINWADFPAWAHPVDPSVFDGCCHEG